MSITDISPLEVSGDRTSADGRSNSLSPSESAIEINRLTKRFGTFFAVDSLSFRVPRGSIFGFLGPNGAGKTTTLGMLLGLVPIDAGSATVLGFNVRSQLPLALSRTGALVERPAFYPYLSGRTNLSLLARIAGINDQSVIDRTLREVDNALVARMPSLAATRPA